MINRRDFIKLSAASGAAIYLSSIIGHARAVASEKLNFSSISPIDRSQPAQTAQMFLADDPARAHAILWNKKAFIGKNPIPPYSQQHRVVIIGGGISGLLSAYLLRKYKPLILEQATRFGGNSKAQSWQGIDFALGAAYICEPEEQSPIHLLLKELGLLNKGKLKKEEDPVCLDGKIFKAFWNGETASPRAKPQFDKLRTYFEKVLAGDEIPFPEIPLNEDHKNTSYVQSLDEKSFKTHLESIIGEKLHPHIESAIEHYCWSSLGASSNEISAAAGLNFYAAEFGNLLVYPGGNAAIAENVLLKLFETLPAENLQTDSLVYNVQALQNYNLVTYQNAQRELITVKAEYVIMACPKFIAAKLIDDLEPERLAAIRRLRYRAYLVANVLLKAKTSADFYDLYMLGSGNTDSTSPYKASSKQKVTDVILANFASGPAKHTVLSLYRGMPYDFARAELYSDNAFEKYKAAFEEQVTKDILPSLNFKAEDIQDLRIARWGHPLPMAEPGVIKDGTMQRLSLPYKDRIYFIEQDNWALPAFETSASEAIKWTEIILSHLK